MAFALPYGESATLLMTRFFRFFQGLFSLNSAKPDLQSLPHKSHFLSLSFFCSSLDSPISLHFPLMPAITSASPPAHPAKDHRQTLLLILQMWCWCHPIQTYCCHSSMPSHFLLTFSLSSTPILFSAILLYSQLLHFCTGDTES